MKKVSVSASPVSTAGGGLKVNSMPGSLSSGFVRRSFVTGRSSLCLQQACRWRAGAGPAILCGKFRTGHEAAICSSRPSAASSQMQKHFSYWRLQRREEDGNQNQNVPVTFHLEGKPLTSHDCTVIWHLLKRINTFSV